MKRSGMIRRIIIAFMIITFLSGCLEGLAEGILPSLTENTGTAMPSITEALQRDPDSETENADGSLTECYTNISNDDYETFSVYLQKEGAVLADYKLENNVLTAEIQANDASFSLNYDLGSGEAKVTYPAGTYGKKAQKAEKQPGAEEQEGDGEQYKKIGNIVTFGTYEQDNNLENGPEAIEWIVLDYDEKENKTLLFSKFGLDAFQYQNEGKETTWEECDARKWLNAFFLGRAFSEKERKTILTSEVDNSQNQSYYLWEATGGNNTQDQVFLLSWAEVNRYFGVGATGDEGYSEPCDPKAYAVLTPYAYEKMIELSKSCPTDPPQPLTMWCLRTPTFTQNCAVYINEIGECKSNWGFTPCSARPALWLDLGAVERELTPSMKNDDQESVDNGNPAEMESEDGIVLYKKPESIVTFGTYEQDNNLENGPEAIEWIVLDYDEKEQKSLLISKYALDAFSYHSELKKITWEECFIRKWLNTVFLHSAFNLEEQKTILTTEVDNSHNQDHIDWRTEEQNNTRDQVFLLSFAEAERYYHVMWDNGESNKESRAAPTAYAIAHGAPTSDRYRTADDKPAGPWWLRSKITDDDFSIVATVSEKGGCRGEGVNMLFSVRPVLWLDLEAFEEVLSNSADKDPAETERKARTAAYSKIGNIVTYGMYEQDNNMENGLEPIEWIVLDYDGNENKALLLSKYGLDTIGDLEDGITAWADCSQRKWLNEYFVYSAFSQEERKAIPVTEVDDIEGLDHLAHEKGELQFAQDRVFLLSKREAAFYLGVTDISAYESQNVRARVAPTPYAITQGAFVSDEFKTAEGLPAGSWLIRINRYDTKGCNVNEGGTTKEDELEPKRGGGLPRVARPAFWLDLNVLEGLLSSAEAGNDDENPKEEEHEAKVAEYSRAGNIVTYGRYEQDNNLENGPEPIEWVVLTVDDVQHRSMLISKYGLDIINYGEAHNSKDITWEDSAARKWLNKFFLYSAFSEEERKAIPETEVDNSDSLKNMADKKAEVNNTRDRIYLLSRSEAALYLGAGISWRNEPEEYALCLRARVAPTPYAVTMGAYVNDQFQTAEGLKAGQWLLRTYAGDRQGEPVSQAGTFAGAIPGNTGSGSALVARPVFWLDLDAVGETLQLSAEEKTYDENPEEADRKAKKELYSKAGNTVTFGRYEQDNDPANGPEPIEWIVLTYDGENHRAMLLSKYGLDTLKFDENYRYGQKTIWETCSAREWLNNDFFNNAFSNEEQKAIPMTEVDNSDNLNPSRGQKEKSTNTQDQVFLLSKSEAEVYLGAGRSWRNEPEEYAVCLKARVAPTDYAVAHGALISDQFQTMEGKPAVKWLLRTSDNVYRNVMAVNESGTFGDSDPKEKDSSSLPVARPALWLDLDADIF